MIGDVQRSVDVPREPGCQVVLPIRLTNRETGRFVDVEARIAEPGLVPHVTLDYVCYLFPEYAVLDESSYVRSDFTWWSPFFRISLNNVSDSFTRATSTYGRLAPVDGEQSVLLSAGIARTMFERHEGDTKTTLCYPISWPFRTALADLRQTAVLVLGTDSTDEGLARMKIIQSELSDGDFRGVIIRDLLDPPDMSLEEKVGMFAASGAFCVVESSFASGAIAELSLLKAMRATVVLLREQGTGSSFMQADYTVDSPNIREFTYVMDPGSVGPLSLVDALGQGIRWARAWKKEKATWLDQHLPWREEQVLLEEVGANSWRVRYIREFALHLAEGVGSAIAKDYQPQIGNVAAGLDGTIAVELECGSRTAIVEARILQDVFSWPSQISYTVQVGGGGRHVVEYLHKPVRDLAELDENYPEQDHLWGFWEVIGEQRDPLTVTRVAAWFEP